MFKIVRHAEEKKSNKKTADDNTPTSLSLVKSITDHILHNKKTFLVLIDFFSRYAKGS